MGICIWLTGLSGAGKSTIARAVVEALLARGTRASLLDGDELRARMSSDLGFSKVDRDTHVMRVARLALEIVERGEIAVCAVISPYRDTRQRARTLIASHRFVEVFVDTPLEVCEQRDNKGLYAKARRGDLLNLTGVGDPYEAPLSPDLSVTSIDGRVVEIVGRMLTVIDRRAQQG